MFLMPGSCLIFAPLLEFRLTDSTRLHCDVAARQLAKPLCLLCIYLAADT